MDMLNNCLSTLFDTLLVNESEYYDPIKYIFQQYTELLRTYQIVLAKDNNYWKSIYIYIIFYSVYIFCQRNIFVLNLSNQERKVHQLNQYYKKHSSIIYQSISPYGICPGCLDDKYKEVKYNLIEKTNKYFNFIYNNIIDYIKNAINKK